MKKYYWTSVVLLFVGACTARFVKEGQPRAVSRQSKEEVITLMGDLVQESIATTEQLAQLQARLCLELRAAAQGTQTLLSGRSPTAIQELKKELTQEITRQTEHHEKRKKLLADLQR